MKIKVRHTLGQIAEFEVSKCLSVKELKKKVQEQFNIAPKAQKLLYSGKILNDGNDLQDLKVGSGHTIMLMERQVLAEVTGKSTNKEEEPNDEPPKMEEIDPDADEEPQPSTSGAALTTQAIEDVRKVCPELAETMEQELKDDVAIEDEACDKCKKKPNRNCKVCGCQICGLKDRPDVQLFCEECQYVTHMDCLDPPLDKIPEEDFYCPWCKNDENEIVKAGQKVRMTNKTAKQACNILKEKKKMGKKVRDWGGGESTVGRRKTCTKVGQHHFGPIPGIEVGMVWESRMQLSEEGIHRPPVGGIAGSATSSGAQSLVLNGGYEDDVDHGFEFYYTGAGGRDLSGNKRTGDPSEDQKFERQNLALAMCIEGNWSTKKLPPAGGLEAKNWKNGKPVRVSRGAKFAKHSDYAPVEGYRYDGIYKMVKYEASQSAAHGFIVYKYLLRRDDPSPAPWEEGAPKFQMIKKSDDAEKDSKVAGKKRKMEEDNEDGGKKAKLDHFVLDEETKQILLRDTKNSKLWKECIEHKADNKLRWLDNVETNFDCIVCCSLLYMPVTTECSHNLCLGCYNRSISAECFTCPFCRADMPKDLGVNEDLRAALNALFQGYETAREPVKPQKKAKGGGKKGKASKASSDEEEEAGGEKTEDRGQEAAPDNEKDEESTTKEGEVAPEPTTPPKKRRPGPASRTGRAPGPASRTGRPQASTAKEPSPTPSDDEEDAPRRRGGRKRKSYKEVSDDEDF